MIKNNRLNKRMIKLQRDTAQKKEHYKMYKAGKNWLLAGITIMFFGMGVSFGVPTAKADTNLASSSEIVTSRTENDSELK
ncbi:KxYKxGKxW signal peptide domain-containing protein [Pediococcus cellicola]|nr:KxYKxGKxW signal peptide domain-containing protein [Pediococcus cellicola]GEL15135.1 hypothetical protein PCE01_09370 [Pediococcus cellicola]